MASGAQLKSGMPKEYLRALSRNGENQKRVRAVASFIARSITNESCPEDVAKEAYSVVKGADDPESPFMIYLARTIGRLEGVPAEEAASAAEEASLEVEHDVYVLMSSMGPTYGEAYVKVSLEDPDY